MSHSPLNVCAQFKDDLDLYAIPKSTLAPSASHFRLSSSSRAKRKIKRELPFHTVTPILSFVSMPVQDHNSKIRTEDIGASAKSDRLAGAQVEAGVRVEWIDLTSDSDNGELVQGMAVTQARRKEEDGPLWSASTLVVEETDIILEGGGQSW
ncbi:hypothetical protein VKT23_009426 [Stygiomarasmius scandens]|uniref:Uncharacterized protein n=1 Tax=Marasmiellus scandens TaxID=2682957 RepID=A0ABR1JGB2_9AGAR